TDNHLMLLDLRASPLSGKDAEERLARIGITVNKNTVPGETRKAMVTSGVRIGTPAVTTRGLREDDMKRMGKAIALALTSHDADLTKGKAIVDELCAAFPLYEGSLGQKGYVG
ncbi:MAG: serine hydroxymethyltransferase, partial [Silvanigrellales bacterium]|nr:serine hydroxymethyltransferase [Silvanigrellales bacterium]